MVLAAQTLYDTMARTPLRTAAGYHRFSFPAMGTTNEVLFAAASPARAGAFRNEVLRWLAEFEASYSRFLPSSLLSRINAAAGHAWVAVGPDTEELFALCDWLYERTAAILDPTAGPLVELWDCHRVPPTVPTEQAIEAARAKVGWHKVQRRPGAVFLPQAGMRLDLGGLAKEYAVDRVFELARTAGFADIMVNLGNDLRVAGQPPEGGAWRIGLEHPEQAGQCWSGVALAQGAICCSGDYLRHFVAEGRRYGHIIDPRTGQPVYNGCKAVWVIAPTCTEAGALTTAAFVLGSTEGLDLVELTHHAAGCIWSEQGISQTRRFATYGIQRETVLA